MNINLSDNLDIDAQTTMTGRGCIIGQSGSGKSYLVGVIVEELCKLGLPFVIVDTEGEYGSLKSNFNILWVGAEKGADLNIDMDYRMLFAQSIENSVPVIFDVSEVIDKTDYVYRMLQSLYALEEEMRVPYLVIIEEADKFAPQIVHPKANPIEEISVRGRKRGIGLLVATQRPANISKNVLAQCSYGFIGKLSIENDLQAVSILFDDRKKLNSLVGMKTGSFVPFGLPNNEVIRVKKRIVEHIGATPKLSVAKSDVRIGNIIDSLKKEKGSYPKIGRQSREEIEAYVLRSAITQEDADSYAQKLLKKRFVVFGPSTEGIDSVAPMYLECIGCRVRVPKNTRNEYKDYYALLKGNEFVNLKKGLRFAKTHVQKPRALSGDEAILLRQIAIKRKSTADKIAKDLRIEESKVRQTLSKLKKADLVNEQEGKYNIVDYEPMLQREVIPNDGRNVAADQVINSGEMSENGARLLLSNILPGSQILDIEKVLVPLYRITLRSGNKVRVFNIDGLFGKPLNI